MDAKRNGLNIVPYKIQVYKGFELKRYQISCYLRVLFLGTFLVSSRALAQVLELSTQ